MIIYIIGYGRSGTTALSQEIEKKLNGINLGEVKYLYRSDKDDLLDPFWLSFKKDNKELVLDSSYYKSDSILGLLLAEKSSEYCEKWHQIFKKMGLDIEEDTIIDSSKTTMDSFMRGINLKRCFDKVLFIQPKRSFLAIVRSLFKGKNSNIERGWKKKRTSRIIHALFIGLPHLSITLLLSQLYRYYGVEIIELAKMEEEVEGFIEKNNLQRQKTAQDLPMVYGNRSRKK